MTSGAKQINSAAIILTQGEKVLLALRDNNPEISYPNTWGYAGGGRLDSGETYLEAAKRELKEETGYISSKPIHALSREYALEDGTVVKSEIFYEKYDGVQKLECFEGQRIEFMTLSEVKTKPLAKGVLQAVETVFGCLADKADI